MRIFFRLAAVFAMFAPGACTTTLPPTALGTINVVGEVQANTNSATALDIVFVYDSKVIDLLPATGPDWFDKKQALMKGLATGIEVLSLEVPPMTLVNPGLPARASKAVGVYSYVNYLTAAGQPKCNLTPYKSMVIWLTPDTVVCTGK